MSKEYRWAWERRRERGFWARLLFWRQPGLDAEGGQWVRKRPAGIFARLDEHAELLAADDRERGW